MQVLYGSVQENETCDITFACASKNINTITDDNNNINISSVCLMFGGGYRTTSWLSKFRWCSILFILDIVLQIKN